MNKLLLLLAVVLLASCKTIGGVTYIGYSEEDLAIVNNTDLSVYDNNSPVKNPCGPTRIIFSGPGVTQYDNGCCWIVGPYPAKYCYN